MKDDRYLVTGCGDAEMRVWKITDRNETKNTVEHLASMLELTGIDESDDPTVSIFVTLFLCRYNLKLLFYEIIRKRTVL